MTTITTPTPTTLDPGCARLLDELGFCSGPGEQGYSRGNVGIVLADDWLTVTISEPAQVRDALAGESEGPGLWKTVYRGGKPQRVFEAPASNRDGDLLGDDDPLCERDLGSRVADRAGNGTTEHGEAPSEASLLVAWALSTADGETDPDWQAPPRAELDALVQGKLTVQTGARVHRGHLVHEPARLALRFPLASTPPRPAQGQSAWLRHNLGHARDLFRMVRLVSDGSEVAAEVDLTNAPRALVAPLLGVSLSGLRHVVARLGTTIDFLTDPSVRSRALANTANSIERTI